jgi:ubiquitin-like 1-activating enzyme E1 B
MAYGFVNKVDLDTIDLSNLNRQFLFQKQHIKKSKAHVRAVNTICHNVNLEATRTELVHFLNFCR